MQVSGFSWQTPEVFSVLQQSRAQLDRCASLGDGLCLAQWRNRDDLTHYQQPGHHTLSVYLEGGVDVGWQGNGAAPSAQGAPGRHCLLPAEHQSQWQVNGLLRFVHLYVSPQDWAERVLRLLDAEPRAYTFEQRVFAHDAHLARWAQHMERLDWADDPTCRLHAHMFSHAALDHLVLQAARPGQRQAAQAAPSGGLAPAVRRRVLAYIDAHLASMGEGEGEVAEAKPGADANPLSLQRLPELAHLSPYHFARMFRVSTGHSVHGWITRCRVARAQLLLQKKDWPLGEVAAACGLGSASHLIRHFKKLVGATPVQWRAASQGRGALWCLVGPGELQISP